MTEIKVKEAAKILGRHPAHVAKMIRSGEIKARKRGKTWYLNREYITRIAAAMPSAKEASRSNLRQGRLKGKVSKKREPKAKAPAVKIQAKQPPKIKTMTARDRLEPMFLRWKDAIENGDVQAMKAARIEWERVTA